MRISDWSSDVCSSDLGSLDRLHRFSSTFDILRVRIDAHVKRYARAQHWDLRGGRLQMSDCWINIMPKGCAHSFHLHPQSVASGTYYVPTPPGASGLAYEDPRMAQLMAGPPRRTAAQPRMTENGMGAWRRRGVQ